MDGSSIFCPQICHTNNLTKNTDQVKKIEETTMFIQWKCILKIFSSKMNINTGSLQVIPM